MRALRIVGSLTVALGVYAAVLLVFEATLFESQRQVEDAMRRRLQALNDEHRALEVITVKLVAFMREYESRSAKLALLDDMLPDQPQPDVMATSLTNLASSNGLALSRCSAGPVVRKGFYEELPFEIAVAGSQDALGRFLGRISRLSRLVTVSRIEARRAGGRIDATIGIVAYRWRDRSTPYEITA